LIQAADSAKDQQPSPTLTLPINLNNKCNSTNLKENQYPMQPSALHKTKKNTNQIFPTRKYNPQVGLKLILLAKKQVVFMSCDSRKEN